MVREMNGAEEKKNAETMISPNTDQDASRQDASFDGKMPSCCCSTEEINGVRHTIRSEADQKALLTRLKKIEGQVRGIEKMVEQNLYCPDILIQVSAATSALNSFNKVLLQEHIKGCVTTDIKQGKYEKVDELCKILPRLMK